MDLVVFNNKVYEIERMNNVTALTLVDDPELIQVLNKVKTKPQKEKVSPKEGGKRRGRPPKITPPKITPPTDR